MHAWDMQVMHLYDHRALGCSALSSQLHQLHDDGVREVNAAARCQPIGKRGAAPRSYPLKRHPLPARCVNHSLHAQKVAWWQVH